MAESNVSKILIESYQGALTVFVMLTIFFLLNIPAVQRKLHKLYKARYFHFYSSGDSGLSSGDIGGYGSGFGGECGGGGDCGAGGDCGGGA